VRRVASSGTWPWKKLAAYDLRETFGVDINMFQGGGISRVGRYLTEPWDTAERTVDDLIAFRGVLATPTIGNSPFVASTFPFLRCRQQS
jgi:hypothetical protein